MKALKLTGITLLTLFIVVGALWLSTGGGGRSVEAIVSAKGKGLQDNITNFYAQADNWSKAAYDSIKTFEIDMAAKHEEISSDEQKGLIDYLNTAAANRVGELMQEEFSRADCNASRIAALYGGIEFLAPKAGTNHNSIKNMTRCYQEYVALCRFVQGSFIYTPSFNGSSWTPFATHHNATVAQCNAHKSNSDYTQYLSNITALSTALNAIPGKAGASGRRADYYERLEQKIEYYYNEKLLLSDEDLNQLKGHYDRFKAEAGGNSRAAQRLFYFYQEKKSEAKSHTSDRYNNIDY